MICRSSAVKSEATTAICARIAAGESLRSICRDETMPDKATVFRWLAADPEFDSQYKTARRRSTPLSPALQVRQIQSPLSSVPPDAQSAIALNRNEIMAELAQKQAHVRQFGIDSVHFNELYGHLTPHEWDALRHSWLLEWNARPSLSSLSQPTVASFAFNEGEAVQYGQTSNQR